MSWTLSLPKGCRNRLWRACRIHRSL